MTLCWSTLVLSATSEPGNEHCVTKQVSWPAAGERARFAWPTLTEAVAGSLLTSSCLRLTDLGPISTISAEPAEMGSFSINGGAFLASPQKIRNGDRVRARVRAASQADGRATLTAVFDGQFRLASFAVRTVNLATTNRAATTYQVGPTRAIKQLSEIAPQLLAGDTVLVDSGVYAPVRFERSGTQALPITIRGDRNARPVISGGSYAVSFIGAHHMVFEHFEITGSRLACVFNQANELTLRALFVHDCDRHGILGADLGNGSNIIEHSELTRTGSHPIGEHRKHPIYIATDRDAFPNARLRVQHSYLHNNIGESIKSRSARTEIYYNWIDVGVDAKSLYTLALYGFEVYRTSDGLNSDVVGNVLVHRGRYGIRLGGDGTGDSKGRVRLANNTIILGADFGQAPVIRLFQSIDSVFLVNNAVIRSGGSSDPVRLFRNEIEPSAWASGRIKLAGVSNLLPPQSIIDPVPTHEWRMPLDGPALLRSTDLTAIDVTPQAGSVLINSATSLRDIEADYDIGDRLLILERSIWPRPPVSGASLPELGRRDVQRRTIGAY
jgi:hypothetical protein